MVYTLSMFENLLYQNVSSLLADDIQNKKLPNSLLFSGPLYAGKLTCALELARVISCRGSKMGSWNCTCPSCLKHKSLVNNDVMLMGQRENLLEMKGAAESFLKAARESSSYLQAAQYFFLRSVRKLSKRFSPILWKDDDKVSKISPLVEKIDELLEELEPSRALLPLEKLEKIVDDLLKTSEKLESGFLYDILPIAQIRNVSQWARYTVAEGKKVVIIENVERMQESGRNALLKILEEPPENTIFILTTSARGAVMPTILSRVRTYAFIERNETQQSEVVRRVFHGVGNSIEHYLLSFLPVRREIIQKNAQLFFEALSGKTQCNVELLVKEMNNFEPKMILSLFFNDILALQRNQLLSIGNFSENIEQQQLLEKILVKIKKSYSEITTYNISVLASLEKILYGFSL